MKKHPGSKFFSFIERVIDTCVQPLPMNICANVCKIKNCFMIYSGALGKLIREKT
jgi:hypothetical protein